MKFTAKYQAERVASEAASSYATALSGYTATTAGLAPFAGASFEGGLYRLYQPAEIEHWTAAVEEVFPDFQGAIRCFGRDWLCNQFCLDSSRRDNREAMVLIFEIGTGEVLEVPATFLSFHEELLIEDADAALAERFFRDWQCTDSKPIGRNECVGYKTPLFLGGEDEVRNLERMDADVYWTLTGQLLRELRR